MVLTQELILDFAAKIVLELEPIMLEPMAEIEAKKPKEKFCDQNVRESSYGFLILALLKEHSAKVKDEQDAANQQQEHLAEELVSVKRELRQSLETGRK